ncbi:PD-(D/E)XK motif protein [Pseudonocardia lacus]|uniref:PD-(D/E)XK motif protein n=1 Tax=Pseudonocardia lacus TaxID=2835865 RepID=UPI001BDD596A|nr:PD-(D/E)XK motif protein [Pseudonocardia lacus]
MTAPHDWARELRHSWPLLRPRTSTEVTTAPLPLTSDAHPVRLGVDGAGARHLLVPLGEGDTTRGDDGEATLSVRVRTFTFARVPLRYLDIVCLRPDLFDLFDDVLIDVLGAIAAADGPAARAAVDIVARWRALLGTRRGQLLTLVGQMSLFAELTVLDLVTRGRPLDIAWWRGPLREPHDIVLPDRAVEVKAVGATSTSVEIHGVQQLEPPGLPLALVLVDVQEDRDGATLPELVGRVLGRVADRGEAGRLLAAAGYSTPDADRYDERFAVTGLGTVEITEAVPRIVPSSFGPDGVPKGIGAVTYHLGLDSLDVHVQRGESALLEWVGATT